MKPLVLLTMLFQQSLSLTWTAATDNVTSQENLQYELRQSLLPDIDTVGNAERNGTVVKPYMANVTMDTIMDLIPGTYYYNVIVKDEAGNKAVYVMKQKTIFPPEPPPLSDPPKVTLTSPADGETVSKKIRIKAEMTDDNGIVRTDIYLDGAWWWGTTDAESLNQEWNTSPYKNRGTVTVSVSSRDADNQITTKSVRVQVR